MEHVPTDNQMTRLETIFAMVQRYKIQLRKRWWVLLLCASIAVCAQAWKISNEPIVFASFARMAAIGNVEMNRGGSFYENTRDFYGTQMELVQSGEVRRRVFDRLEAMHPDLDPVPVEIDVTRTRNSSVINLQATGSEPEYVQVYLDAVLDEFINVRKEMRSNMTDTTLNSITEELLRLERELKTGESELKSFFDNNSIVLLQGEENKAAQYLERLEAEKRVLEKEFELYEQLDLDQTIERRQNLIDGAEDGGELAAIAVGAAEKDFLTTKQKLALMKSDLQTMARIFKPNHPNMIEMQEEIDRMNVLLNIYRDQSLENLKKTQDALALRIRTLESEITKWEEIALDTSRRLAEHSQIVAKLERTRSLYEKLLVSLRELDLSKSLQQESLSVMERATKSTRLEPEKVGPILSGFGLGLILGIGILVLVERLDDRMNTLAEFQAHFGEDVLGHIPQQQDKDGSPILEPEDERHIFAESYRNLRSSILFKQWGKEPPKCILITSSIPSEGKTTTACNLSITMATAGAKVLLVDCDLRRGAIHDILDTDNSPGMGEILTEQVIWQDCVKETKTPNLYLIPRGEHLSQTSEHLLSSVTPKFLKEARDQYDYVMIDSAPIMAADDTTSLAPYADTVIFVLRLSSTPARLVASSLDQLYDRQVNVGGVVLNHTNTHLRDYNYYNYYSYYANHGYLDYYTSKPKG